MDQNQGVYYRSGRSPLHSKWYTSAALVVATLLVSIDLAKNHAVNTHYAQSSDLLLAEELNPHSTRAPQPFRLISAPSFLLEHLVHIPPVASVAGLIFADSALNQGDRISINSRLINSRWSRQGEAVFIPDAYLIQEFGLDVLDTENASRQPIQWFSDASEALPVSQTAFDGQFRYLDIADLAQQKGWRVRPQGDVLSIETPAAQMVSVRHGRQSWGDRLVVDLDQPTPFRVVSGIGTVSITLDASLPPALLLPSADRTNELSDIDAVVNGGQTTLTLDFNSQKHARVWTVSSPPRIVIDINAGDLPEKSIQWIPGLWWHQQIVRVGAADFPVTFLKVLPNNGSDITLKPIWPNPSAMPGIAPLATTVQQWQAVAAINGGFFNRNNQLPLGAIRSDGRWYSGPILNRGAIAWNNNGDVLMGRLSLQDTLRLPTGQTFPSLHLNSGYVQAGLSRYTSAWGASYTPLTDFETLITVQDDRIVRQQRFERAGSQSVPVPPNGYMIAARSYQTAADALEPGTSIQTETAVYPSEFDAYRQIIGAGPLLIQNGQIVLNAASEGFSDAFIRQRAPRSAIAKLSSGELLMVAVQHRIGGTGPTLQEMAQILQQMGASDALNLDGGNSASLYLGGRMINRSSRTVGRVHNGIGIFVDR